MPVGFINPDDLPAGRDRPVVDLRRSARPSLAGQLPCDYADRSEPGLGTSGYADSFRELYFPGPEVFCDTTGNCASRPDTQSAAPGYDSLTGLGSPGTNFVDALAGL